MGVFLTPADESRRGPSVEDMQAKIGQLALENDFFGRCARSYRRCERKEMIDRAAMACLTVILSYRPFAATIPTTSET